MNRTIVVKWVFPAQVQIHPSLEFVEIRVGSARLLKTDPDDAFNLADYMSLNSFRPKVFQAIPVLVDEVFDKCFKQGWFNVSSPIVKLWWINT